MKHTFVRLVAPLFLTSILTLCAPSAPAQTQNTGSGKTATTSEKKTTSTEKKQTAGPFRGKLAALDRSAKTITVGKRTFQVSAETKILKNNKAATLDDGVVDEIVSGYFKTADNGKLVATKLNLGPKTDTKAEKKKSK